MKPQQNFNQKNIFILLFFFFFATAISCSAQPFITAWKTDNLGTSNNTSITIPTYPNETYNYDVDWDNDGVFDEFGITGDVTHNFGVVGTYTIAIQGTFPRIYFNDSLDKEKIIAINQWGSNVWTSMEKAFYGCSNLNSPTADAPNLSMVTDMSYMFANAHSFNQPLDSWNVSNVTDMSYMFSEAVFFNQDISSWNVSNVTNMRGMFYAASDFNQPLDTWNVSNVTDMSGMLSGWHLQPNDFNQPLNTWNVSNVTNMSLMFYSARFFNQDLSSWNVSNVTNMSNMFRGSAFNQDIGSWNVSNVTNMIGMFAVSSFNQPLNAWNVSNVTDMSVMFFSSFFNQPLDTWNVSNVTDMGGMFFISTFNQPLNTWNVSNVTDMTDMLSYSNLSISNYDNTLIGWESQGITNKNLYADGLRYCASDSIRNNLINLSGWTITGDSIDDISCKTVATTSLNTIDVFEIYPNPTNGQFLINAEFEKPLNDVQIEIFNTNWQIIKKIKIGNNINAIQEKIDLSNLTKGSYYVLIRSELEQIGKMILLH